MHGLQWGVVSLCLVQHIRSRIVADPETNRAIERQTAKPPTDRAPLQFGAVVNRAASAFPGGANPHSTLRHSIPSHGSIISGVEIEHPHDPELDVEVVSISILLIKHQK